MEKILIFIKHHLTFLWNGIESLNTLIFMLLFKSRIDRVVVSVIAECKQQPYIFRRLNASNAQSLFQLIASQPKDDLRYFSPHGFELKSVQKQFKKKSFLMMGVFDEEILIGYFFLRFFANKKCFVGRLIDRNYRGKGIGLTMNKIMYHIAWESGFRCLSTISRHNKAIMKAHGKNSSMIILKELQNNYLLVEFVESKK